MFIESLPLLYEENLSALLPAVEANREDLVKILVLYESNKIEAAVELAPTENMQEFLQSCLAENTREFLYVHQAHWFRACQAGDVQFVKQYRSAYLNYKDPTFDPAIKNMTGLQEAVIYNQLSIAELLLGEQGNRWKNGKTALMMAAELGSQQFCLLLQNELGMQDEYGWNALMYAVDGEKMNCIQPLMKEMHQRNEFKMTAVDIARQRGMAAVLKQFQVVGVE